MYADDIDISAIEREYTKMGLAVNEGKTKYMVSTSRDVRRIDSRITADNYTFDTVKKFISVWRSNEGSVLPTGAIMVWMGIE